MPIGHPRSKKDSESYAETDQAIRRRSFKNRADERNREGDQRRAIRRSKPAPGECLCDKAAANEESRDSGCCRPWKWPAVVQEVPAVENEQATENAAAK